MGREGGRECAGSVVMVGWWARGPAEQERCDGHAAVVVRQPPPLDPERERKRREEGKLIREREITAHQLYSTHAYT